METLQLGLCVLPDLPGAVCLTGIICSGKKLISLLHVPLFWLIPHNLLIVCDLPKIEYRIVENFRGRKLSWILPLCGYTQKFSPRNLGRGILWRCKSEQSVKVFSAKSYFHQIAKVFSLESFPLYGTLHESIVTAALFMLCTVSADLHKLMKCSQ